MHSCTSLLDLPNELLTYIIDCLSNEHSISKLSRTCKRLRRLCHTRLYHHIILRKGRDSLVKKSLYREPSLQRLVRKISVYNRDASLSEKLPRCVVSTEQLFNQRQLRIRKYTNENGKKSKNGNGDGNGNGNENENEYLQEQGHSVKPITNFINVETLMVLDRADTKRPNLHLILQGLPNLKHLLASPYEFHAALKANVVPILESIDILRDSIAFSPREPRIHRQRRNRASVHEILSHQEQARQNSASQFHPLIHFGSFALSNLNPDCITILANLGLQSIQLRRDDPNEKASESRRTENTLIQLVKRIPTLNSLRGLPVTKRFLRKIQFENIRVFDCVVPSTCNLRNICHYIAGHLFRDALFLQDFRLVNENEEKFKLPSWFFRHILDHAGSSSSDSTIRQATTTTTTSTRNDPLPLPASQLKVLVLANMNIDVKELCKLSHRATSLKSIALFRYLDFFPNGRGGGYNASDNNSIHSYDLEKSGNGYKVLLGEDRRTIRNAFPRAVIKFRDPYSSTGSNDPFPNQINSSSSWV